MNPLRRWPVCGAVMLTSLPVPTLADPPSNDYHLIWSDEFDGEQLDMKKWAHRSLGPRRDAINVPEAVALDGEGHLVLTTTRVINDDGKTEYHTGMIGTHESFSHRYGYWECRAQMQENIGHWSAFWIQSPTIGKPVDDPGKAGVEIDVYEYLVREPEVTYQGVHYNGYGKEHKYAGGKVKAKGLGEGFHTFGLLWTPEEYVFFIDGQESRRVKEAISHRDQYIILSLEVGDWGGDIAKAELPDSLLVDWVRVYDNTPIEVPVKEEEKEEEPDASEG